jgi:hypothetical protein
MHRDFSASTLGTTRIDFFRCLKDSFDVLYEEGETAPEDALYRPAHQKIGASWPLRRRGPVPTVCRRLPEGLVRWPDEIAVVMENYRPQG